MPHFNEHALELSIMELFQQEGYTYTSGEEIHKEVSERRLASGRYAPISAQSIQSRKHYAVRD